ncbi:MAG: signal recognition particle-docking protein FtsY, partial [Pseudomonas sp.]|nr:signal recognition particle-docking protein FtsY [Pseudomonas sp.]
MFGSKDDKNPPAEADTQAQPMSEEKKSLFSWWRKKPAETAVESTQSAPIEQPVTQAPVEPPTPEPGPVAEPEVTEVASAPAPQPEPQAAEPPAAPVVIEPPPVVSEPVVEAAPVAAAPALVAAPATQEKPSFFARLKQGLSKTSASLGEGMASLFLGKKAIDDDL